MDLSLSMRIRRRRVSGAPILDNLDNLEFIYCPSDNNGLLTSFIGSSTVEARRDGDDVEASLYPDAAGLLRTAADGGGDTWQTWATAGGGDGTAYAIDWNDQSSSGNDASQTTANLQAQLVDTNGQTVITGDLTDDYYQFTDVNLTGDFSLFVVAAWETAVYFLGNNPGVVPFIQRGANVVFFRNATTIGYTFPHTLGEVHVLTAIRTSGTIVVRKNGTQTDSQAHAGDFLFNLLGARSPSITNMDKIMAVFLFSDAVTSDERDSIEDYLATEFVDQL